jgi:ABC-type multidrug transport system fused ATPase/permease subunit
MAIQQALEELAQGRTTLMVAHRLSTAARAGRIVVLDGDQIVESGTHAELVANQGRYALLWRAASQPALSARSPV